MSKLQRRKSDIGPKLASHGSDLEPHTSCAPGSGYSSTFCSDHCTNDSHDYAGNRRPSITSLEPATIVAPPSPSTSQHESTPSTTTPLTKPLASLSLSQQGPDHTKSTSDNAPISPTTSEKSNASPTAENAALPPAADAALAATKVSPMTTNSTATTAQPVAASAESKVPADHFFRDKFKNWIPPTSTSFSDSATSTDQSPEQGRAQWFNYENFKESMYQRLLHRGRGPGTPSSPSY